MCDLERNDHTEFQIAAAIPLSLVVVLCLQSQARRELILNAVPMLPPTSSRPSTS